MARRQGALVSVAVALVFAPRWAAEAQHLHATQGETEVRGSGGSLWFLDLAGPGELLGLSEEERPGAKASSGSANASATEGHEASPRDAATGTSEGLSSAELRWRKILYGGIIACIALALLIGGLIVAVRQEGALKVTVLTDLRCGRPSCGGVVVGSVAVVAWTAGMLAGAKVQKYEWRVIVWALSAATGMAGVAVAIRTGITFETGIFDLLSRSFVSKYQDCQQQPDDARPEDEQPDDEKPNQEQLLPLEPEGCYYLYSQHKRSALAMVLFVYVATCVCIPPAFSKTVSCDNGFFWEAHMAFVAVFLATKIIELLINTHDGSLHVQLSATKFMMLFLPSFMGFSDGYTDSMSIEIAGACARDTENEHKAAIAGLLSHTMFWTFMVGVVFLQWILLGGLALRFDTSHACLFKILHMDTVANRIHIPPEEMWLWHWVCIARTFGEDVPQAMQQTVLVIEVKENPFVILSIAASVMCSFKALHEACTRLPKAIGDLIVRPQTPDVRGDVRDVPEGFCMNGCGRKVQAGMTSSGTPFRTCCRGCALGYGHDLTCNNIDTELVKPGRCLNGCGRPVRRGTTVAGRPYTTCCRGCASGTHDPLCGQEAAAEPGMCKGGCGRKVAPAVHGRAFDTCCARCARTGGKEHSATCLAN